MRRRHASFRAAGLSLLALLVPPTLALGGPRPELDVTAGLRPAAATRAAASRARQDANLLRNVRPTSFDTRYDMPTMLWANRLPTATGASAARPGPASAEAAARRHLGEVSSFYRLQPADVSDAPLRYVHDTGRGGVVVAFQQSVDGIEVFRDEVRVLMNRQHELVAVSGYIPSRSLLARAGAPEFSLRAERAVKLAIEDFAGQAASENAIRHHADAEGGYQRYDVSAAVAGLPDGVKPSEPVRVKKVLFHMPDALVPAWYVELMAAEQAYMYVVDARDGRLLFRHDLMTYDIFHYRVFAQTTGVMMPHDGPQGTAASPHPTGTPDLFLPAFVAPNLVSLQNGPISTNDPWLAPGATQSTGNNVDAFADLVAPDGFSAGDLRASTTSANTFDRVYNLAQDPAVSNDQRQASVTQLFYVNNFLHDWFYDSGFDEASRNAQSDNFGRGGLGGDALRAEAQDYGGLNNANMATPPDGTSGRMQMYIFQPAGTSSTQVHTPPSLAGTYATGVANGFGPQTFSVTADLVLGIDGTAPVNDGCTALTNAGAVAGKIALLDRGLCNFSAKALAAQNAGAVGLIIADNVASSAPPGMGGTAGGITIPTLSVTQATGNAMKAALGGGTVNLTLTRQASLRRDGTIDNQIVAHEWGHFISNRLIGNAAGISTQQAAGMGEGWGDFLAMLITVRPEDIGFPANANWTGAYGAGAYALHSSVAATNAYYFGIRRVPYSTDFNKNGFTFKHIQNGIALPVGPPTAFGHDGLNNAEVHNTGEVWCTMLWECYAELLKDNVRLTFDQAQQRMRDYLTLGMKLTPNAPTFTEARDAILLAAYLGDPADFALFWDAFARRGMGVGAVSPGRFDPNNATVVESFVTGGMLSATDGNITVEFRDCDGDGYLDNGEIGELNLVLQNSGSSTLSNTTVTLSSASPNLTFPTGNVVNLPPVAPFEAGSVSVPIELLGAVGPEFITISASYNDPGLAIPGPYVAHVWIRANVDEVPSFTETVETHSPPWTPSGTPLGAEQWFRCPVTPTDHVFLGPDQGTAADIVLMTPPLLVGAGNFTFSFQHKYDFEIDATNFYDGGMIEISTDGGTIWNDVGLAPGALLPGYTSTLFTGSGNPLSGRQAYSGQSPGYPSFSVVNANLGAAYQGQTVRLRFRIGTDVAVGGAGWQITSLTFDNLTAPPFFDLGPNASDCTPVSVDPAAPRDLAFALAGPNPTRGQVRFRLGLPAAGRVELGIYDVTGRRVATLERGELAAGWYDRAWTVNDDGSQPGSGMYFARFLAGGRVMNSRVVLIR
jgi:hypothetical protein